MRKSILIASHRTCIRRVYLRPRFQRLPVKYTGDVLNVIKRVRVTCVHVFICNVTYPGKNVLTKNSLNPHVCLSPEVRRMRFDRDSVRSIKTRRVFYPTFYTKMLRHGQIFSLALNFVKNLSH